MIALGSRKQSIITGRTSVYGIVGDPVSHSLSPVFWNAAFRAIGLDAIYVPFQVSADRLAVALAGLQALGVKGVNVTLPHKQAAFSACTSIEPPAAEIGAVNTLQLRDDGTIHGWNTDALAMVELLGSFKRHEKVLLLGAGGAAKAVLWSLFQIEVNVIYWTNRTASRLNSPWKTGRTQLRAVPWESKLLQEIMRESTLIINATSLGWRADDSLPWMTQSLTPRHHYLDLNYNSSSSLISEARASGAKVTDGLELLIRQGALAFTRLTGFPAPVAIMRRALQNYLRRTSAFSHNGSCQFYEDTSPSDSAITSANSKVQRRKPSDQSRSRR